MTTADWALVISICSAFLALASFIWSVWSKFIYPKARVETTFSIMETQSVDGRGWISAISLGSIRNSVYEGQPMRV